MGKWRLTDDNLCPWSLSRRTTQPGPGSWGGHWGVLGGRGSGHFAQPKESFLLALALPCPLRPWPHPPLLGLGDHQPHNHGSGRGPLSAFCSGLPLPPSTQHPGGLEPVPNGCPGSSLLTKSAKSPARHIYFCPAGFINTWAREPASAELERLKSWI